MFVRTQVVSCFIVLLLLPSVTLFFFFNDTATTEIYTLSLHDALPISPSDDRVHDHPLRPIQDVDLAIREGGHVQLGRSEEHTSELQSRLHLVCRLLLEKKKESSQLLRSKTAHPIHRPQSIRHSSRSHI